MKHKKRVWDGEVWKVTYRFGEKIGRDKFGRISDEIEILLSKAGDLLTAYPF